MTEENIPSYFTPPNAFLLLEDGSIFWGKGIGKFGSTCGEICFNTSMTGYQEVLTDPSYAHQLITFTFPHVGNVGIDPADNESRAIFAKGVILREDPTTPSHYSANSSFIDWLIEHNITGISNIDTRALTLHIRRKNTQNAVICYLEKHASLENAVKDAQQTLRTMPKMEGLELASAVSCKEAYVWEKSESAEQFLYKIIVLDFGVKHATLACLSRLGCKVIILPAKSDYATIMHYAPDGVLLSNGPGDPYATALYTTPLLQQLFQTPIPIMGICLGHQLIALALGMKTRKMQQGHRGANHPVQDLDTKKIYITSQNHGFEVVADTDRIGDVVITHRSLFDGSVEGLRADRKNSPVFSVQYHPESGPGPHDSYYLFEEFMAHVKTYKTFKEEEKRILCPKD